MLRSSFCDYSDAYLVVKGTEIVANTPKATALTNREKK